MVEHDGYIYRYDPWLEHLDLFEEKLRARHWSRRTKNSHPHVSLIEAERSLRGEEGIFRISFWKNLPAAVQSFGASFRSSLAVLQRVRADHPFFEGFTREDDDWLPSTAWLYWKVSERAGEQEWSEDGISTDDVEVLDFDGSWRRFSDALIMKQAEARLAGHGFQPFYFGNYPSAIYYASRLTFNERGERQVFVLLYQPPESKGRIYQDDKVLAAFALAFFQAHVVERETVRFFIFDDAVHKFHAVHVGEFDPKPVWNEISGPRRWFDRLPVIGRDPQYELAFRVDGDRVHWQSADSDLGQRLVSMFNLPTTRRMIDWYAALLDRKEGEPVKLISRVE
ncbi:hypothetical protein WM24_27290 [Burkholderia ubonensis]|uniref:hypothetical protein n=1 Tax=Burkholderia ubonensis TaxID=101571 RepID=UPI000758D06F|nr:hypothetical protein [Burkholderia ubonensis]KWN79228.1 hypothetical protein WM24_27290 [Burkholderia ubonensis]